ncbi:MAG: 30S ribosomal protein S8 [Parcubacteria group bacterium GW2011_GWC2_45_7]|nr:MAG: 30S ribosomal protein S8 [Parcubacteria group bacterium GW2011_GWC2_45_7]KKU73524.1 MAG: 30S ribosomal protein S8 [Parcubacteria group bacterium GW2011_GWA2_47_26]
MTDPIADMLTRIRNASAVGIKEVLLPYSAVKLAIAKILEREGYLAFAGKAEHSLTGQQLKLTLRYDAPKKSRIREIRRVSTPGRRVYVGHRQLSQVTRGLGMAIVSTPKGIMTNKEAKEQKLGGEVICEVY